MKDVKINIYDLEKIFINLRAGINILEIYNSHEEKSSEIKLMLKNIQQCLFKLENVVYDIDDTD